MAENQNQSSFFETRQTKSVFLIGVWPNKYTSKATGEIVDRGRIRILVPGVVGYGDQSRNVITSEEADFGKSVDADKFSNLDFHRSGPIPAQITFSESSSTRMVKGSAPITTKSMVVYEIKLLNGAAPAPSKV